MDIQIVNFSQGPFNFNNVIWQELKNKENISIDAMCQLRYSHNAEIAGIQFDFTIINEETLILKDGFLFGLKIGNWVDFVAKTDLSEDKSAIIEILNFIWPAVIGVVASQTSSDNAFPLILPAIDIEEYAKQVILKLT